MSRNRRILRALVLVHAAITIAACDRGDEQAVVTRQNPYVPVDSGTIRIFTATDAFSLNVEIAETEEAQAFGLMERDVLPANEGMVFVYGEPEARAFYMYQTRIPLSIAFFDADSTIVSILEMMPCTYPRSDLCDTYSSGVPFVGAVEANQDYFETRGIQAGDRIELERSERPLQ
jgi:uncharacterized membrane protein (UPF0127 family)